MKIYRNRPWMIEHYIERKESTPVMAQKVSCSCVTIRYWLRKLGIPVRSRGEGAFLALRNSLTLSSKLLDLLEGELLGDGCISMHGNRSALYQHSSKYEEYVVWLSGQFAGLGLGQVGKILKYQNNLGTTFRYTSKSYPELASIHQRWYPKGKKTVPKDLKLMPIMARQWYIGDGSLAHRKDGRPNIVFSTDGFDKQSVDFLVKELCGQGFKVTVRRPAHNEIGLSAYSVKDFLSWIGPCPIGCYAYKWNY